MPANKNILFAGQFSDFFKAASAKYPESASFYFSYVPSEQAVEDELNSFRSRIRNFDTVVVCVANPASARYAKLAYEAGKQVYIISVMSPYFALAFKDSIPGIAVYSFSAESFTAAMAVLSGAYIPVGVMPLAIKTSELKL